ncbi:MAG TPA: hypothetical protein VMT80_00585 [Candidatus Paceibacterota bacterium]|nr:hypothetical protein [Candidatus Paceibacterota bacterium]
MSDITRNVLIALGISFLTIGTIIASVSYLNRMRIAELNSLQEQLSVDSLSFETQFSLLESAPCAETVSSTDKTSTDLTSELDELGEKLSYEQQQLGTGNAQVLALARQYSLFEIRDYLITKEIAAACKTKTVTVLYFYSNAGDCADCAKAGNALSYLHDTYPNLRIYSFDYHLGLGALDTLKSQLKLSGSLPAFVINGKTYYGFTSLDDLKKEFPKGALATTTPAS